MMILSLAFHGSDRQFCPTSASSAPAADPANSLRTAFQAASQLEGHAMEGHRARRPCAHDLRLPRRQHRSAPTATVSLPTAARMVGLMPDQACDLAASGAFPCSVIATVHGYRVPFAALMHHLKSRRSRPADDEGTISASRSVGAGPPC